MIITAVSIIAAVVSTTWTIAQHVNKPDIKSIETNFSDKLDKVMQSMSKIIDLLHETRQKYVTKDQFDKRSSEVDKKEEEQTKRFIQKYKQVYDRCSDIEAKLDAHIIQWAKQEH